MLSQFRGNVVFPRDCAVVFGSAVHNEVEAGPGIKRRVGTAVHLLEEGSLHRLIFTGGVGWMDRLSEARVMQHEALRLGVDPEVITLEEGATSTWQSIKFVQPLLTDCKSVVGISDRYHLARIRLLSWRQGLDLQVHPAERTAEFLFEAKMVLREAAANMAYLFAW